MAKCKADIAPIKKGSNNVFANGKSVGRVGDPTCTAIMQGSRSVLTNGRPTARLGDANVPHCSPMVQAQASNSVFANGIGISRVGDLNTPHLRPGGGDTPVDPNQFDGATSMAEWSSNPTGYSGSF